MFICLSFCVGVYGDLGNVCDVCVGCASVVLIVVAPSAQIIDVK